MQGPASSVGFRGRRPEARNGEEPTARSSVKPSHPANDNLIERTLTLWKPRLRRDLSREDARQIAENVIGFFNILAEWSRAELPGPANDNALPLEAGRAESERRFEETIQPGGQGGSRS
jgi:hypothetical protein